MLTTLFLVMYLWMFSRYAVHCFAHCATGSICLALNVSDVHAAKWVHGENCDLAGAALQILPVRERVCVLQQVFPLPGLLLLPLRCAVALGRMCGRRTVPLSLGGRGGADGQGGPSDEMSRRKRRWIWKT